MGEPITTVYQFFCRHEVLAAFTVFGIVFAFLRRIMKEGYDV